MGLKSVPCTDLVQSPLAGNLCTPLCAESGTEDAPNPQSARRMAVHSCPCSCVWLRPQDGEHITAIPSLGPTKMEATQPGWEQRGGKRWVGQDPSSLLPANAVGSWAGIAPEAQQDGAHGISNDGRSVTSWTCCCPGNGKATTRLCCVFCSPVQAAALVQQAQQSQAQSPGQETAETSWGLEKKKKIKQPENQPPQ